MQTIARFRGEYKFLSNFAPSPFKMGDYIYPTVEHAYQEAKTDDPERKKLIREALTPGEAARLGRAPETVVRPDWNSVKVDVMRKLVGLKFDSNPDLAKKLVDTYPDLLIEGNNWHDNFFGVCTCPRCHNSDVQPQNWLGEMLMEIRRRYMDCQVASTDLLDLEDSILPYPDEEPNCNRFMSVRGNPAFNVCREHAPWSCHRTKKEGQCPVEQAKKEVEKVKPIPPLEQVIDELAKKEPM